MPERSESTTSRPTMIWLNIPEAQEPVRESFENCRAAKSSLGLDLIKLVFVNSSSEGLKIELIEHVALSRNLSLVHLDPSIFHHLCRSDLSIIIL